MGFVANHHFTYFTNQTTPPMQSTELVAKTAQGLEDVLADEITRLGATVTVKGQRVVHFMADQAMMYKANLHLRTAFRIMMPVASFTANSPDELYREAYKTEWEQYFTTNDSFAIDFTIHSPLFSHSQFAALRIKDAIADRFRNLFSNQRPSVDTYDPDFLVQLHISGNECHLLLDSSGQSLHKRGYRTFQVAAPLNEVLAAGMVMLSGWDGQTVLYDPMCGSGTIAIEAALLQRDIAPGLFREKFGFQSWKNYDDKLWKSTVSDALRQSKPSPDAPIYASDILSSAIKKSVENAQNAGLPDINFFTADFISDKPLIEETGGFIFINPPYGERLEQYQINNFYKDIGNTLKRQYKNYTAWLLTAHLEGLKHIGLQTSKRITLFNGPLECRLVQYKMY